MNQDAGAIADFKSATEEILQNATLDPDLKKLLIEKLFAEREQLRQLGLKSQEFAAATTLSKRQFWHNTPLVVALVGSITIAANAIGSLVVGHFSSSNDARREASKDERAFAFKIIEGELAKSEGTEARANVLLFLVRAGILNSLNRDELEKMAVNDLKQIGKGDGSDIGIPPTLGSSIPNYSLAVPAIVKGQTVAATRLLALAVGEINQDVEEKASPDTVAKYFTAVPDVQFSGDTSTLPWSGAFIAWLISGAGNPDGMKLSASNFSMWKSCKQVGIVLDLKGKIVLPGDLMFFARKAEDAPAIKDDPTITTAMMHAGVVYQIRGSSMDLISGNVANGIRLSTMDVQDQRLVGFARIGSSVKGAN